MTTSTDQQHSQAETPLLGKKILITRSRQQASRFAAQLRAYGAEPVEVPAIEIAPPSSWEPMDNAISRIHAYDWLIFTSVNGVRAFVERCEVHRQSLNDMQGHHICAIGPATAQELRARGMRVDVMPEEYRAEAVVERLSAFPLAGRRLLLPRAAVARDVLPRALTALGARVEVVEAYRTLLPTDGLAPDVWQLLTGQGIDVITFTSSSTVTNFAQLTGETDLSALFHSTVIACIGPITADTARAYGLTPAIVPQEYTIPGLTQAIVDFFRGHREERTTG
jgi:uroporphyrinogen III methyltransferase / synthase